MSCNISSPELTTINLTDHQFGRVSGRLSRLKGSSGRLRAIPDEGYQFVSWQTDTDETYSTNNPLSIDSWDNMTLTPVFEPITLTLQDFQDQDAVDALVWYLETRGVYQAQDNVHSHGTSWHPPTYYSAGDYTTASGTHDRFASTTPKTLYPMRYGFNYGDSTTGSGNQRLGKATYDPTTNTTTGVFLRSPATYTHRDHVTVPELIHRKANALPVGTYGPGGWDNNTYFHYGYNQGNSGTYHANGLQFPMLQHARSEGITIDPRSHNDDWIDLTGLESLDPYYIRTNYFDRDQNGFRDVDAVSGWSKLYRWDFQHGGNYWSRSSTAWRTTPSRSPRPVEGFTYCYNLNQLYMMSQTWDPDSYENIDENPGWVTQYNNTPRSGDVLRVLRYSPVSVLRHRANQNVVDYSLTNTYFSNLEYLYNYQTRNQSNGYDLTDTYNNSFKNCNITQFYNYDNNHYTSNYNFLSGGDLIYFYDNKSNYNHPMDLSFVEGSTLSRFYIHGNTINFMIVDPLHGETVALHVDFTSPTGQDRSRYQSAISHSDTGVTSTSIN